LDGFNGHLANSRKPEASTPTRRSNFDEFIDNLDELLLSDLAGHIERMSVFDATSTHTAPELVGSDSNRSEEATQSNSLSDLEEDLDRLLKIGDEGATACRGPLFSNNYSDSDDNPESFKGSHLSLTITSTGLHRKTDCYTGRA
jgi:hypothetical protein